MIGQLQSDLFGRTPLFVYGSLMDNHDLRQLLLGERSPPYQLGTLPGYERLHIGNGFYKIEPNEGRDTEGKVLWIKPEGLRNLDTNLQGHFELRSVDVVVESRTIEVPTYFSVHDRVKTTNPLTMARALVA